METTGVKRNKRGGKRVPVKLTSPGSRMLHCLITTFGGPSAFARLVGETRQVIIAWRHRGFIPLKKVHHVSKVLSIDPIYLNFQQVCSLLPDMASKWENIVRQAPIEAGMKKWILGANKL